MAEFRTDITADRTQFDATMEGMAQKAMTESQRMQSSMREAFVQVGNAAGESFKKMNSQFDSIIDGVKAVRGAFAAAAAVVGGGAMFGKAITQSAELTDATRKLAIMLGVTLEKASTLRTALGMIGMGTDDYTSAVAKMTMKLRENEERFNELGIATRGSNNELLSGEEVMQNGLKALLQYKEGTDRNLASTEIFGKGWAQMQDLMRLTPAVLEAAREKAEELQTQIGPAGAARALQYKFAMNEIKEVGEALANRIGQALMPILTDMGQWLAGIGPAAVTVMRGALGGLLTVVYAVENGIVVMVRLISAALYTVIEPLAAMVEASALAVTGHFSEAGARLKQIPQNISARWKDEFEEILKSGDKTRERIAALFDPAVEQGASPGGDRGGKSYTGKKDTSGAAQSRISEWEKDLEEQRDAYDKQMLAQGSFQTVTREMERDYWKQILAFKDLSDEERIAASKKYYAVEREIRKAAFEAEIADMKERAARYQQGSIERIQLAGEAAAKIGEKFGLESKEYKQALGEMSKMAEERYKQQQKLEDMALERTKESRVSVIELERQALDDAEKLGLIHADKKLARLKQLKELEFQIELQAENDVAAIYDLDEVAHQQHLDKVAKLKEKHAADMTKLDGQIAVESKKTIDLLVDPISSSFQKLMDGMIQGTQTWSQAFRKACLAAGEEYLALGVKLLAGEAKTALLKTFQAPGAGIASAAGGAATTTGAAASGGLFGDAVTLLRGIFYDPAKDVMKTVEKSSTDVITSVGQNSNSVIGEMGTSMVSWWSHLGDMTSSAFSGIGALLSSAFSGLLSTLGSLGATLWSWASSVGSTLWDWASSIGSTVWEGIKGLGATLWDWASSIGSSIWGAVQGFGGWIAEAGSTLWNWAGSIGSSLSGAIGTIFGGIGDALTGLFDGIGSLLGIGSSGGGTSGLASIGSAISNFFSGGGPEELGGGPAVEAALANMSGGDMATMITGGASGAGFGSALLGASGVGLIAAIGMSSGWGADPVWTTQMADAMAKSQGYAGVNDPAWIAINTPAWAIPGNAFSIPTYAIGTDYVPRDTLARVHKGEAIIPADANPFNGGSFGSGGLTVQFNGVLDAQSFWDNNQGEIVRVLTDAQRTFSTGLA